jgi:tripartite-type tricarboxylate transporter receptor subunit TctC
MISRRLFIATGAVALTGVKPAFAQANYPDHTMRILVGYPAGGGVDLVARLVVEPMREALGQPVIVENRAGAAAMIAAQAVAKAGNDGHTLLMAASGEVTINKHLYKDKMTYQPETELRAFVASESDKFAKIIQEASITLGN